MHPLLLLWWVGIVSGQHLESPDGACKEGWHCKKQRHCGPFLDLKDRVDRLQTIFQEGRDESVGAQFEKQLGRPVKEIDELDEIDGDVLELDP